VHVLTKPDGWFPLVGAYMQVVACTPDSAAADEIHHASAHFKLPNKLRCKVGNIELQVSGKLDYLELQYTM
jgi:hypothetical protein